ncbi:MAG: hypothetical protein WKF40_09510 [Thermoleophilaceae bacterium]
MRELRRHTEGMTRFQRNANIGAVLVPFLAVLAAIPLLWNSLVGTTELAIMVTIYLATAFSITIGYHRLLTHRAFETYRPLKYLFAIVGSMAVQGPWSAGWPTTASTTPTPTRRAIPIPPTSGTAAACAVCGTPTWAGCGSRTASPSGKKYAPDLLEDAGMRFISRNFLWWVLLGLAIPFGWASLSAAR